MDRYYNYELPYWADEEEQKRLSDAPTLEQRYKMLFPDKPLLAKDIENVPVVKDIPFVKYHLPGSIFKLTDKQGKAIMKLVEELESDCE